MTTRELVDATLKRAAQRAFIRTLAQGYESALAGLTVSVAAILAFIDNPDWVALGVMAGSILLTPVVGAARAYFGIIGKGLPDEYFDAAVMEYEAPVIR